MNPWPIALVALAATLIVLSLRYRARKRREEERWKMQRDLVRQSAAGMSDDYRLGLSRWFTADISDLSDEQRASLRRWVTAMEEADGSRATGELHT